MTHDHDHGIRLWQRMLHAEHPAAAWADAWDATDVDEELQVQEEHAQHVYANLAPIMAQFGQVEDGLVALLLSDLRQHGIATAEQIRAVESLTFGKALLHLRPVVEQAGLTATLASQLITLDEAVRARNRLTHGRIRVGVARWGLDRPPEPVIVLVFYKGSADELDEPADMALALRATNALVDVMARLGLPL